MRNALRWTAMLLLGVVALVGGAVLTYAAVLYGELPPLDNLQAYEPALITRVYDRRGELLAEVADERREIFALDAIPEHVRRAFMAAEDARFYDHLGIEPLAIVRAAFKNVAAGRAKQGASTITQQVARSFFLTQDKTFARKIKEVFLALKLERNLSKDEILFLYLNQIYLGRGAYGVGAAADMYFGKRPDQLTVAEGAILAGLPQRPSVYAPHIRPRSARVRQEYVIGEMVNNGWLTAAQAEAALATTVVVRRWESPFWQAPYAAEEVRRWLFERFGSDTVLRGGLKVYTTIDLNATRAAQDAVRRGVADLDKRQGFRGPIAQVAKKDVADWRRRHAAAMREQLSVALAGEVSAWVGPQPATAAEAAALTTQPVTAVVTAGLEFEGLVTGFVPKQNAAWVDFGLGVGRLPADGMLWARAAVAPTRSLITDPRQALQVGDLVRVRRYEVPDDAATVAERWSLPQEAVERIAKTAAALTDAKTPHHGALLLMLEQEPPAQAALVSVLPQSGEVVALVGGYDYAQSQFSRASQAHRQPGSAFKPIVYSAALDAGFTAASILIDTPVVYQDAEREFSWKPKNYEGKFYGPMTLVDALTFSRNVVTIQLVRKVGLRAVQQRARALGIASELPDNLSMALGSGTVTPWEILKPYATFAAGGRRPELSLVREVWDATGRAVYNYVPPVTDGVAMRYAPFAAAPPPQPTAVPFRLRAVTASNDMAPAAFSQAVSADNAYLMTYLLRNVVERGTGWRVRVLGRPAAGKTGTTDNNADSWFVGYTPQLATAVWIGYDQVKPLGDYESGARAAAPIWIDYMVAAHRGLPVLDFPVPPGIVIRRIDAETGRLASPLSQKIIFVPFREGTEPDAAGAEPSGSGATPWLRETDFLHQTSDW